MSHLTRYDDLNTKTIGYLTFMSVILLIVIVLLLQALCYNWIDWQEQGKLVKQGYPSSDEVIAKQRELLTKYGKNEIVVTEPAVAGDKSGKPTGEAAKPKTVEQTQIPLDRASELLLGELKSQTPPATPKT